MNKLSTAIPDPSFLDQENGWPIPYRPSGLEGPKTPVLMLHGLESHSGWFVQSSEHVAGLGHPVYAMDRKGSGESKAPRGSCYDFRDMLAEIQSLARKIMGDHQVTHFHLLGHCFGAIPATAFACENFSTLKSLILATPAIYTREEPATADKLKIFWSALSGRDMRIPVSLRTAWFTDQEKYARFIEEDTLALRNASARLYWEVMRARRYIHANEQKLTMPLMTAVAGGDRICDNEKNQRFFDRLPARKKEEHLYPKAVHILEYSDEKDAFFSDLAAWLNKLEQTSPTTKHG